ncbi:MAG: hypothetical protein ABWX74_13590 [Aeromicrobium sp.]
MVRFRPSLLIACGVALGLVVGGTTVAIAASSGPTVKVCTTSKGVVRSASSNGTCPRRTTKRAINVTGPAGPVGPQGSQGLQGEQGTQGVPGSQGIQGPGTTDINYVSTNTSGLTVVQLGDITVTGHCTGGQVNLFGFSNSSAIRLAGTHGLGTSAPVSDRLAGASFTPAIQHSDSAWVDWVITNQTTGQSVSLQLFGVHETGNTCRFTGQLIP